MPKPCSSSGKTDTLTEAQKPGVEASKFLEQQPPQAKADALAEARKPGVEVSKFLLPEALAKVELPTPTPEDPAIIALKKALAERKVKDLNFWDEYHAHEVQMLDHRLGILYAEKGADFDAMQAQERDALKAAHKEKRSGIQGFIDAIQSRWNPELAAEKTRQRRREVGQLQRRQEIERRDYLALLEQSKQMEIDNLKERQALKRADVEQELEKDEERYIREHKEADRILAEMKAREHEKNWSTTTVSGTGRRPRRWENNLARCLCNTPRAGS